MGRGQRPGRRGRGGRAGFARDGGGAERILVLPGEELSAPGLRPGPGTYRVGGRIYASVLGLLARHPPVVRVIPLSGRYIPKSGDTVVGIVTDVQGTFWLLDIGAPRWAPLHMTGTPWKMDFGETDRYLRVGDTVVVRVEQIENSGRIGVTMLGDGLGKLMGGTIVTISPAKVPRVIGKSGSMARVLTSLTDTKLAVGQNGRVWVDGPPDGVRRVREALRLIDEEGQRSGLTERVQEFLETGRVDTEPEGPRPLSFRRGPVPPPPVPSASGEEESAPSEDESPGPDAPRFREDGSEENAETGEPPERPEWADD